MITIGPAPSYRITRRTAWMISFCLTFFVSAAASLGACAAQQPPTLAEERAFLDTLRSRSAVRLVEYRKVAAERESIYASIDRTRLARIRELDALLTQRTGSP